MHKLIFLFLFVLRPPNNREGFDERPHHIDDNNNNIIKINKIHQHFQKKKILDILQSNHTSLNDKVKIVNEFNLLQKNQSGNLLSGGLLNNWNSDFF